MVEPRSNAYCEYHWWFTNVRLSCPWAGGLFRLLMASWFTWRKLFISFCSIWILTAWGLAGGRWRRSSCRCCFWSSPPPPPPPSSPSRPWSLRSRWWWRRGWGGTGGGSWRPGLIRRDCQHPHRGTWKQCTLLIKIFHSFIFCLLFEFSFHLLVLSGNMIFTFLFSFSFSPFVFCEKELSSTFFQ